MDFGTNRCSKVCDIGLTGRGPWWRIWMYYSESDEDGQKLIPFLCLPKVAVERLAFRRSRVRLSAILTTFRGFNGFSQFLKANIWIVLRADHSCFLPYRFQFITHNQSRIQRYAAEKASPDKARKLRKCLKHSGCYMYHLLASIFIYSVFCPKSVLMFFVWFSE
jgi:hypothetical protein